MAVPAQPEMNNKSTADDCFYCYFNQLTQEFHYEKFSLEHGRVEDFIESHWQQRDSKTTSWLVYRWLLTGFFTTTIAYDVILNFEHGKWLIYFTDWGYILCVFTSFLGACLVSVHHCSTNVIKPGDSILKIYWASHFTCLVSAIFISTVYWIFMFPYGDVKAFDPINFQAHAVNSILMIFDQMLVAFPTHILHCVYPMILISIYGAFSLIYQLTGGHNIKNEPFIYKILNWKHTGSAILSFIGLILLMCTLGIVAYELYRIRCAIYQRYNKKNTN